MSGSENPTRTPVSAAQRPAVRSRTITLTASRRMVLETLVQIWAREGRPVTHRELCAATGMRSSSSVHSHLVALRVLGLVEARGEAGVGSRPTRAALDLTAELLEALCPTCKRPWMEEAWMEEA
jgi:SOS-response transcriptional repressor LexA